MCGYVCVLYRITCKGTAIIETPSTYTLMGLVDIDAQGISNLMHLMVPIHIYTYDTFMYI